MLYYQFDGRKCLPPIAQSLDIFPNPGSTFTESNIVFNLTLPEQIELTLYDALGRKVRTLAEGNYPAGQHQISWKPSSNHASQSWGFVQLKTTKLTISKKLVWIP